MVTKPPESTCVPLTCCFCWLPNASRLKSAWMRALVMVASLGRTTAKVTVAVVVLGLFAGSIIQPAPDSSMHFQRLVKVTVPGVE